MKTLNYSDCIWEKRKAKENGFDEPIFLNTKGEIAREQQLIYFSFQRTKF